MKAEAALLSKEIGSNGGYPRIYDVFVPIIPVIVATGLFMGVRGLSDCLMTLLQRWTPHTNLD